MQGCEATVTGSGDRVIFFTNVTEAMFLIPVSNVFQNFYTIEGGDSTGCFYGRYSNCGKKIPIFFPLQG